MRPTRVWTRPRSRPSPPPRHCSCSGTRGRGRAVEVERSRATGWVGWVLFGGMMLVLLGSVHLSVGLLAVFEPAALAGSRAEDLLGLPLAVLAWLQVLLGAGAIGTGVALIRGLRWARVVTVAVAVV